MTYRLGKLIGFLLYPSTALVLALIVGLVLAMSAPRLPRLARAGRVLAGVALALLVVALFSPLDIGLARPLEARFSPPPADAPAPEGIFLLGGGIDTDFEMRTGRIKYGLGAEAVWEAAALALRFPGVPVVVSGAGPITAAGDYTSAASMGRLLSAAGVAPERIVLVRRARTTWEEATLSHEMLNPRPGARWYLVTPAWHMPRSIGAFRGAGWDGVVAYPAVGEVETSRNSNIAPGSRLMRVDVMSREWFGLLAYRLLGRSPTLYPSP